jgi:3-hydroxymyristoyl/3-hydroxydecanoyl-(acyl carrier protein) dehydratase
MQNQSRFVIPQDHPSLPGHFPGRPIVPGVVVLDCAMAVLLRDRPAARLAGFDEVKFVAPISPGVEICVSCNGSSTDRLTFTCVVDGQTVVRGRARLVSTR